MVWYDEQNGVLWSGWPTWTSSSMIAPHIQEFSMEMGEHGPAWRFGKSND